MLSRVRDAGDTLIEVLFAVSVFSFVVVGALAIMNQGSAAAQRSVEITMVRQEIDAQAETLRFLHDAYAAIYQPGMTFNLDAPTTPAEEWYRILVRIKQNEDAGIVAASNFEVGERCPGTAPRGAFILDPRRGAYVTAAGALQPATTFAQVEYPATGMPIARGLWIEAVRQAESGNVNGFIDFHIRACWDGAGMPVASTQGTIVRLYEQR